jgi:hypothetical protein
MKFMRTLRSVAALRRFVSASLSSDLAFKYNPAMRTCRFPRRDYRSAMLEWLDDARARHPRVSLACAGFHLQLY